MTNEKQTKSLEERTNERLITISKLLESTKNSINDITWAKPRDHFETINHRNINLTFEALYNQNLAICNQNEIIIDYLQEIYKLNQQIVRSF